MDSITPAHMPQGHPPLLLPPLSHQHPHKHPQAPVFALFAFIHILLAVPPSPVPPPQQFHLHGAAPISDKRPGSLGAPAARGAFGSAAGGTTVSSGCTLACRGDLGVGHTRAAWLGSRLGQDTCLAPPRPSECSCSGTWRLLTRAL